MRLCVEFEKLSVGYLTCTLFHWKHRHYSPPHGKTAFRQVFVDAPVVQDSRAVRTALVHGITPRVG